MPLGHGCSQWGMAQHHARLTRVNGAWVYHRAQMEHIWNTSQSGTLHRDYPGKVSACLELHQIIANSQGFPGFTAN